MMMVNPGLNDVDVDPLGYDDGDVCPIIWPFSDYKVLLCSHWSREKSVSTRTPELSRCRLPSKNSSLVAPQFMAPVALRLSPCNVPLSNLLIEGPLPPLPPELEHHGDSGNVADGLGVVREV